MSTYTQESSGISKALLFLILAAIAAIAWYGLSALPAIDIHAPQAEVEDEVVYIRLTDHAKERGELAWQIADQCNKSPLGTVRNPATGRTGTICKLGEKHGVLIMEQDGETGVTAFPSKYKTLKQVVDYLIRQGYTEWLG